MAERNIFGRTTKLQNVSERISYTNALKDKEKRKNEFLASYDTVSKSSEPDHAYWRKLAEYNQQQFKKTSNHGRTYTDKATGEQKEYQCIEAREQIIELPNEYYRNLKLYYGSYDLLAKRLASTFKQLFKCECNVAIHINEDKTNLHAHIIFSERESLTEKKIAQRNLFFDENNKRRYKKSEILNEDGSIRDGCRIVKKGTEMNEYTFSSKNAYLKSNAFTEQVKLEFVQIFNEKLRKDKYQVFDRDDVFIAQKKILDSYGDDLKARLKEENQLIRVYNSNARELIEKGYDKQDLLERKHDVLDISKANQTSVEYHNQFIENLRNAIQIMRRKILELKRNLQYTITRSRTIADRANSARDKDAGGSKTKKKSREIER